MASAAPAPSRETAVHLADIVLLAFHTGLAPSTAQDGFGAGLDDCTWVRSGLTAASWFLLGVWFGQGYCLCTDLHWRVQTALGEHVTEKTYIQYLVRRNTGWTPDAELTSNVTAIVFVTTVVLSIILNLRDARRGKVAIRASGT